LVRVSDVVLLIQTPLFIYLYMLLLLEKVVKENYYWKKYI